MRRLLPVVALLLLAAACNFDTRHWPRSSGTQTVVYVEDHAIWWTRPVLSQVVRDISTRSARVELRLLAVGATCPANRNCFEVVTANTDPHGGWTSIAGVDRGILTHAWVTLDDSVGFPHDTWSRFITCHEFLHALGGGHVPSAHDLCDPATGLPRSHDLQDLDRVHAVVDGSPWPPGV